MDFYIVENDECVADYHSLATAQPENGTMQIEYSYGNSPERIHLMKFDVAIVGSGLAGLSVALHLAQTHQVALISKRSLLDGASNWAQGGIAAVLDSDDSRRAAHRGHAGRRRRPVRRKRHPLHRRTRPRSDRMADRARRAVHPRRQRRTGLPPDPRRRPQPAPHHPRRRRHRPRGAGDAGTEGARAIRTSRCWNTITRSTSSPRPSSTPKVGHRPALPRPVSCRTSRPARC